MANHNYMDKKLALKTMRDFAEQGLGCRLAKEAVENEMAYKWKSIIDYAIKFNKTISLDSNNHLYIKLDPKTVELDDSEIICKIDNKYQTLPYTGIYYIMVYDDMSISIKFIEETLK